MYPLCQGVFFHIGLPTRLHAVLLSRTCKVPTPSPSWFDHQTSIWWTLQIMTRCCAVLWTYCTSVLRCGFVTVHLLEGLGLLGISDWPSIKSLFITRKSELLLARSAVLRFSLIQDYKMHSYNIWFVNAMPLRVYVPPAESTDFGTIIKPAAGTKQTALIPTPHRFILTFRNRASSILGQAFHYSPENAFYIFNQQIYFIICYILDRASLI